MTNTVVIALLVCSIRSRICAQQEDLKEIIERLVLYHPKD